MVDSVKCKMQRESNIELLRIIVMLFILMHHLIVHALCPSVLSGKVELSAEYATYSIMEGFFYVGVNVFLLISGYFGIRLRARRIWSLYLQLAFYGLLAYSVGVTLSSVPMVPHTFITKSIFIFSHASSWWFVVCYMMLMIISPFLNVGMRELTKKQYLFGLICYTFLQIYLGWFWQKEAFDTTGYNFLNFIYLYLIGGYLHRFVTIDRIKHARVLTLGSYVGSALIFGTCNIFRLYLNIPFGYLWGYNNPIIIIGAISLFLFALTFKFDSNAINTIAGGGFAAYLLTDIGYTGDVIYRVFGDFAHTITFLPFRIVMTFVIAIFLLLVTSGIELLRVRLMRPIISAFDWVDRRLDV